MPERISAEPTLHDASGDVPALHGRRCIGCGRPFFPPQDYGCEACGAGPGSLVAEDLPGTGTLVASVEVPRRGATSFRVATIVLDSGPAIRAMLDAPRGVKPGTKVRSTLVRSGERDGNEVVELHFVPAGDC